MSILQQTPFGFDWNCAKVERLASDDKKGWVYLGVTTPRDRIEIYVTKSGKVRVYNAKDLTNKKEMT